MKITKRTIGLAAVALLLIGGGTAAVQYIGEINTEAEVEEPVTVDTTSESDFGLGSITDMIAGETRTLSIRTDAHSDAPRIVRVLEIDADSYEYNDLTDARGKLDILWSAEEYSVQESPTETGLGTTDIDMLNSLEWDSVKETGYKAGINNGNLVVCNAHRDSQGDSAGKYKAGEYVKTSYDVTPDYFGGEGSYDIDYSIANECPL